MKTVKFEQCSMRRLSCFYVIVLECVSFVHLVNYCTEMFAFFTRADLPLALRGPLRQTSSRAAHGSRQGARGTWGASYASSMAKIYFKPGRAAPFGCLPLAGVAFHEKTDCENHSRGEREATVNEGRLNGRSKSITKDFCSRRR